MQASGHEKLFHLLRDELLAGLSKLNVKERCFPDVLYLGNWMADFSQFYSPEIPNSILNLLGQKEKKIKQEAFESLRKPLGKLIKDFDWLLMETSESGAEKFKIFFSSLSGGPAESLSDVVLLEIKKAFARIYKEVLRPWLLAALKYIDFLINSPLLAEHLIKKNFPSECMDFLKKFVWVLGAWKFCAPGDQSQEPFQTGSHSNKAKSAPLAVPTNQVQPLPNQTIGKFLPDFGLEKREFKLYVAPGVYCELFAKYFTCYKPYEHLDRFVNPQAVAKVDGGKNRFSSGVLYLAGLPYKKLVTPLDAKRPENQEGDNVVVDKSLLQALKIAYGRLHNLKNIDSNELHTNDRLLLIGRSLHANEDYFAHTNFLDRMLVSLRAVYNFEKTEWEYKKIIQSVLSENLAEELKIEGKLDLSDARVEARMRKGLNECVKSGYFSPEDSNHSIFQFSAGHIREWCGIESNSRQDKFSFKEVVNSTLKDLIEPVEEFINGLANIDDELGANSTDLTLVSQSDFELVFPPKEKTSISIDQLQKLDSFYLNLPQTSASDHPPIPLQIVNSGLSLLTLLRDAEGVPKAYATVRTGVDVVKTTKRLYACIEKLKLLAGPAVDKAPAVLIKSFVKNAILEWLRTIVEEVLVGIERGLHADAGSGSHTTLAKDEAEGQPTLYALAERLALVTDRALLHIALGGSDNTVGDAIPNTTSFHAADPFANSESKVSDAISNIVSHYVADPLDPKAFNFGKVMGKAVSIKSVPTEKAAKHLLENAMTLGGDRNTNLSWLLDVNKKVIWYSYEPVADKGHRWEEGFYISPAYKFVKNEPVIDPNFVFRTKVMPSGSVLLLGLVHSAQLTEGYRVHEENSDDLIEDFIVQQIMHLRNKSASDFDWEKFAPEKFVDAAKKGPTLPLDYRILAAEISSSYGEIWSHTLHDARILNSDQNWQAALKPTQSKVYF